MWPNHFVSAQSPSIVSHSRRSRLSYSCQHCPIQISLKWPVPSRPERSHRTDWLKLCCGRPTRGLFIRLSGPGGLQGCQWYTQRSGPVLAAERPQQCRSAGLSVAHPKERTCIGGRAASAVSVCRAVSGTPKGADLYWRPSGLSGGGWTPGAGRGVFWRRLSGSYRRCRKLDGGAWGVPVTPRCCYSSYFVNGVHQISRVHLIIHDACIHMHIHQRTLKWLSGCVMIL